MIDLKIKNAIASFEHWGTIKPSTANGHALIARAFHAWSNGGLTLYACEPHNHAPMYYACLQTKPKNDPLFIHWQQGICTSKADGDKCFHTDTKNKVNSWYSYYTNIDKIPNKYPEVLSALQHHLCASLGEFQFKDFIDWFDQHLNESTPVSKYGVSTHQRWDTLKLLVPTWSQQDECYRQIVTHTIWTDPIETWPPSLVADELVHLLTNEPSNYRPSLCLYIEKIQAYMDMYPICEWTPAHTDKWITRSSKSTVLTSYTISQAFDEYGTGWATKPGDHVKLPAWADYLSVDIAMMLAQKPNASNHRDIAWLVENSTDPRKSTFDYSQMALGGLMLYRPEYAIAKCSRDALAGAEGWRLLPQFQKVPRHLFEVPAYQYSSETEYFDEVVDAWIDTWTPSDAATVIKTFIEHPEWQQFTTDQYNTIASKILPSELYTLYELSGRDQWILMSTLNALAHDLSTGNIEDTHSLHDLI